MPTLCTDIVDVHVFRPAARGVEFLQLRRAPGSALGETWHNVMGHIEPGESALQAALRELREETALAPLELWQLEGVNTYFLARRDAIMMCPVFAARVAADAAPQLSAEHAAHRWLPGADAAAEFLWPGQRQSVREVLAIIVGKHASEPLLRIRAESGG